MRGGRRNTRLCQGPPHGKVDSQCPRPATRVGHIADPLHRFNSKNLFAWSRVRLNPPYWKELSWRRTQPYAVVSTAIVNIFFGGAPCGATKRVRGVPKWGVEPHANAATGAFGGAPYGATKRVRGVPKWGVEPHASAATGAFGGAPYGATKRVRGVPKWGGGTACERSHHAESDLQFRHGGGMGRRPGQKGKEEDGRNLAQNGSAQLAALCRARRRVHATRADRPGRVPATRVGRPRRASKRLGCTTSSAPCCCEQPPRSFA